MLARQKEVGDFSGKRDRCAARTSGSSLERSKVVASRYGGKVYRVARIAAGDSVSGDGEQSGGNESDAR